MKIKMAVIAKFICKEFNITEQELRGQSRQRKICIPRHIFYYLSYKYGHSLPKIGMWVGGRDHTTVLHGKNVADAYIGQGRLIDLELRVEKFNNELCHNVNGGNNDKQSRPMEQCI